MKKQKTIDKEFEKLSLNEEFTIFITQRFREIADHASLEEMAEWAFGNIADAIIEWKERDSTS